MKIKISFHLLSHILCRIISVHLVATQLKQSGQPFVWMMGSLSHAQGKRSSQTFQGPGSRNQMAFGNQICFSSSGSQMVCAHVRSLSIYFVLLPLLRGLLHFAQTTVATVFQSYPFVLGKLSDWISLNQLSTTPHPAVSRCAGSHGAPLSAGRERRAEGLGRPAKKRAGEQ